MTLDRFILATSGAMVLVSGGGLLVVYGFGAWVLGASAAVGTMVFVGTLEEMVERAEESQ